MFENNRRLISSKFFFLTSNLELDRLRNILPSAIFIFHYVIFILDIITANSCGNQSRKRLNFIDTVVLHPIKLIFLTEVKFYFS